MKEIVTVFQLEIRYDHILNFSQMAREIFAPYVQFSQSLKVENIGTLEERIILNFEEDDYLIIISWNTLLIKGQGDYSKFTSSNSHITFPFLDMFSKLMKLKEFGSIKNVLFAANHLKKLDKNKEETISLFFENSLSKKNNSILGETSDIAITLENKKETSESSIVYGPYYGPEEFKKRRLKPVNPISLGDLEFTGIMAEYKKVYNTNKFNLSVFKSLIEEATESMKALWKIF